MKNRTRMGLGAAWLAAGMLLGGCVTVPAAGSAAPASGAAGSHAAGAHAAQGDVAATHATEGDGTAARAAASDAAREPAAGGTSHAGVGTFAYYHNDLGRVYDHSLPACQEAARRACETLGYVVSDSRGDLVEAEVTARKTAGVKIHIRLLRLADGVTRVRVRVGWFGNRAVAEKIHEEIARQL